MRRYLAVMLNRYLTLSKFLKKSKLKIKDMNFEIYEKYSPPIDSFSAIEFLMTQELMIGYILNFKSINLIQN